MEGNENAETIFQDPQFTDLDTQFLNSLGYAVVEDPEAISKINIDSLVYAIHCYADVYQAVSGGPRPSVMIITDVANFGRFNLYVYERSQKKVALTDIQVREDECRFKESGRYG